MKNIFLEQDFVSGYNAVAYLVKFADKVNFNINIGEPYVYTSPFTQESITAPLNIGYLMVIDNNLLQLIDITKNSRYGDNTEYTPEEQLTMNILNKMDITLSSNELIFIYVHNWNTPLAITDYYRSPNTEYINYPLTYVHLKLFGECKVKLLFKIHNEKTTKYNISYLKKRLFTINYDFNIILLFSRPPRPPRPPISVLIPVLQPNAILYLITLLNKLHIELPSKISIELHLNFPTNTTILSANSGGGPGPKQILNNL